METNIKFCIANLIKNGFEVLYFSDAEKLVSSVISRLNEAKSISRGGSTTVESLGIITKIKEANLPFRDYFSKEDRQESLKADFYLTGSNAITEDGKLVNIDGAGNRVAAMSFGPNHVFIIAGTNKIVPDTNAGLRRIADKAAPMNAKRLSKNTPCAKTGKCSNCDSPERICRKTSIISHVEKNRFTIFLIEGEYGL